MKPGEAQALLKKYRAHKSVIEHVKAVRDYAMDLANKTECDRELVEVGAILHDIGRCKTHTIDHAIVGAKILREEGVDERIVRIVERHVGAGITLAEAEKLGLPPADYLPETIEEKIVCQADNLIGNKERITIHEAIDTAKDKWSPAGVNRLIQLQFEVFRPHEAVLTEKTCNDEMIEEAIGEMDLLYKKCAENGKCIVSLYGKDAEKAVKILKKLMHRQSGD